MIDGDELERSYKHHLSDYAEWEQRDHASNWMLIEDNLGENLSIDETMLQEDLVTILSNKAGHCKQGSVISIVRMMAWLSVDCNWRDMKHGLFGMAENLARESVKRDFLYPEAENGYASGVETPHLVFNYLDYLLWKKEPDKTQFDFEFRNSVEHWYPRNPSNGTFDKWEDGVDRFGNLCLIQRNVNSKFSNMDPVSKKNTFKEMIAKGSLKLRLMAAATDDSATWMESGHMEHQKAMLGILMSDCGLKHRT